MKRFTLFCALFALTAAANAGTLTEKDFTAVKNSTTYTYNGLGVHKTYETIGLADNATKLVTSGSIETKNGTLYDTNTLGDVTVYFEEKNHRTY